MRDEVEVTARVLKTPLVQLPEALAAAAYAVYQTGVLHHAQMFGHSLAGNPGSCCEFGDGGGSLLTKANDQPQTNLVPQCGEESHGAEQLRGSNWTTMLAQGISRRAG